jgi:hypothetical protein
LTDWNVIYSSYICSWHMSHCCRFNWWASHCVEYFFEFDSDRMMSYSATIRKGTTRPLQMDIPYIPPLPRVSSEVILMTLTATTTTEATSTELDGTKWNRQWTHLRGTHNLERSQPPWWSHSEHHKLHGQQWQQWSEDSNYEGGPSLVGNFSRLQTQWDGWGDRVWSCHILVNVQFPYLRGTKCINIG